MTIGANQKLVAADHLVCHNADGSPKSNIARMTGEIILMAGWSCPDGWLICNGQAVSRTTYAALFALIGTNFGVGDGSTTFNLPDFQGRVPVGVGQHSTVNALNRNDGLVLANRTPQHQHAQTTHVHNQKMGGNITDWANAAPVGASNGNGSAMYARGQPGGGSIPSVLTGADLGGGGQTDAGWGAYLVAGNFLIKT